MACKGWNPVLASEVALPETYTRQFLSCKFYSLQPYIQQSTFWGEKKKKESAVLPCSTCSNKFLVNSRKQRNWNILNRNCCDRQSTTKAGGRGDVKNKWWKIEKKERSCICACAQQEKHHLQIRSNAGLTLSLQTNRQQGLQAMGLFPCHRGAQGSGEGTKGKSSWRRKGKRSYGALTKAVMKPGHDVEIQGSSAHTLPRIPGFLMV